MDHVYIIHDPEDTLIAVQIANFLKNHKFRVETKKHSNKMKNIFLIFP